jgi:hypothetical protein
MSSCCIYFRKGSIEVVSESQTDAGFGVGIGPMFKLEAITPRDVGEAVIAALDASCDNVPYSIDLKPSQKELLRLTGARSWGDLTKTAICVGVRSDKSAVTVIPHKSEGGSFLPGGAEIPGLADDVEEIGRAILGILKIPHGV